MDYLRRQSSGLGRPGFGNMAGAAGRVLGWRQRTNAYAHVKKSRSTRVREDSQANKAREGCCGWQVHHHV